MTSTLYDEIADQVGRFINILWVDFSDIEYQYDGPDRIIIRIGLHGVLFNRVIATEAIIMASDHLSELAQSVIQEIREASRQHELSMNRTRDN